MTHHTEVEVTPDGLTYRCADCGRWVVIGPQGMTVINVGDFRACHAGGVGLVVGAEVGA